MVDVRTTKYTQAVADFMKQAGHATNAQILERLHQGYPDLSATTVHRITARMLERGELAAAPPALDNSARFDANLTPHDHFHCLDCDKLRDLQLPEEVANLIQDCVGDCRPTGRLNIQGSCTKCLTDKEDKS